LSLDWDINGEGNQSRLHKDFDWWSLDQRGVVTEEHSMNITTPPCPFKYSTGEPILPFPRMQCNEIVSSLLDVDQIVRLTVGANVSESAFREAAPYVESILYFGDLQSTVSGIQAFGHLFIRQLCHVVYQGCLQPAEVAGKSLLHQYLLIPDQDLRIRVPKGPSFVSSFARDFLPLPSQPACRRLGVQSPLRSCETEKTQH